MKSYEVTSLIEASPAAIWAVLADAAGYPSWDSGVERVDGEVAHGEKISVYSKVSPGRAFPVTVTVLRPYEQMVWSGGMPLGLFRGERTFTLTPDGGATRFTMREEFSGLLLALIWKSMPDLGPSFQQFADGLKQQAEAASVSVA
jgi:hypothetical protein